MAHSRNLQDLAFRRTRNRLVIIQVILVVFAAVIAFPMKGTDFGLALLYGGAVSIAATLVGAWRLQVATDEAKVGSGDFNHASAASSASIAEFYKSAIMRFVVVVALLAIGLGVIKLQGLALLVGFIVAQTGLVFGRPVRAR